MIAERFPALRRDGKKSKQRIGNRMGAVLYCRVSTEDQLDNFSITTQESQCRIWCEREGFEVLKIFTEAASAKTADRPQFQEMLRYCKKNNYVSCVVVYALSRFSRNQRDFLNVCEELRKSDIRLLSVTEQFDSETAAGRLQQAMISMFAQYDNDQRSERTRAGMRTALEAGKWCHKAPLGYVTDASSPGGLRPDPDRAALVRQAFEMYGGGNVTKIAVLEKLTGLGLTMRDSGKAPSAQTFDKMLRNPVYAGLIVSNSWDVVQHGKFEPIIDIELFERVQEQLRATVTPLAERRSLHSDDFPLRVFVRCSGCGKGITGSFATGRKGRRYPHYTCRSAGCRAVKFSRDVLHQKFISFLHSLGANGGYMDLFREVLVRVWKQRMAANENLQALTHSRLSELEARKRKLLDAVLDKRIPQSVYDEEMKTVGTAIQELEARQGEILPTNEQVERLLAFADWILDRLAGLWNAAPLHTKLRIQTALFPNGIIVDAEGLGTASTPIFCNVLEPIPIAEIALASPRGFEPLLSP